MNGCYPDLARDPDHYEMLILNLQCLRAANPSTPDKKIKQSSGQSQEWVSQVNLPVCREAGNARVSPVERMPDPTNTATLEVRKKSAPTPTSASKNRPARC